MLRHGDQDEGVVAGVPGASIHRSLGSDSEPRKERPHKNFRTVFGRRNGKATTTRLLLGVDGLKPHERNGDDPIWMGKSFKRSLSAPLLQD